jgi:pSer/pThr/pTyr-binding forkhead associated (FHA) protein
VDSDYIELRSGEDTRVVPLEVTELSIGRGADNDLALAKDTAVSRVHAAIRLFAGSWCVRDLGSANGTLVNGQRIQGEKALEPGDEITIGKSTLVLHSSMRPYGDETIGGVVRPEVTRREHDVLVALCRPAKTPDLFTEPASVREIAEALFITEAAVKQHLGHLFEKFDIGEGERRRSRLANEAFRRGSISRLDLDPAS